MLSVAIFVDVSPILTPWWQKTIIFKWINLEDNTTCFITSINPNPLIQCQKTVSLKLEFISEYDIFWYFHWFKRSHFKETSPHEPNPEFFQMLFPCKTVDILICRFLICRYFDEGHRNVWGWMKKKYSRFSQECFLKCSYFVALLFISYLHTAIKPLLNRDLVFGDTSHNDAFHFQSR